MRNQAGRLPEVDASSPPKSAALCPMTCSKRLPSHHLSSATLHSKPECHGRSNNPIEYPWKLVKETIARDNPNLATAAHNNETLQRLYEAAVEAWEALRKICSNI
jgi:hypothetical protein